MKASPTASFYLVEQISIPRGKLALFAGRSNVGKSSLINALLKQNAAKVAKSPGKTRSINCYRLDSRLTIVDLPGYGFAKRSQTERDQWRDLIRAFFDLLPAGTPVYLLMDAKRDLEGKDLEFIEALLERNLPIHLLLTKADRLRQGEKVQRERKIQVWIRNQFKENTLTYRFVSSKTNEGVDSIRRQLLKYVQES